MNRERLAWLVSIILLAILAFQLPGTLGQRDDEYSWMRPLVEIHRQVLDNYVDPVDDGALKQKAIEGMLGALDDPYTDYIPPDHEEEFDKELGGTFSGVGISLRAKSGAKWWSRRRSKEAPLTRPASTPATSSSRWTASRSPDWRSTRS